MATLKGNLEGILQSLNKAKSDDKSRYFMNECYLDRSEGETTLVATNGRMMATYKPDSDAIKALKLESVPSGYIVIDPKRLMVSPFAFDAQYPNWRKVVPDSADYIAMKSHGFEAGGKYYKSADMLARFVLESGMLIKHEYYESVAMFPDGVTYILKDETARAKRAMYYTAKHCGQYMAVIMPYGTD